MDARSKRREATRRQLEQQLKERQAREARRRRTTLIASVVGSVAVIALVVVLVVVLAGGNDDKSKPKAGASSPAAGTATASTTAPAVTLGTPVACAKPTGKLTATYAGVTVGEATNLRHEPKVASKAPAVAKALACADLVVGKGTAATPASTVSVQYTGVLYKNGTKFDSSWARKAAASFSLAQVVKGFTQGIGGTGKVTPMHVGGRRIIVVPAQLGYGTQSPSSAIPANSDLVFVVDLLSVK